MYSAEGLPLASLQVRLYSAKLTTHQQPLYPNAHAEGFSVLNPQYQCIHFLTIHSPQSVIHLHCRPFLISFLSFVGGL